MSETIISQKAAQSKYRKTEKGKAATKRYRQNEKGKATQKRYRQTEKGKGTDKRYSQTVKFKTVQKRYRQSEKGKAVKKRYNRTDKGKVAISRGCNKYQKAFPGRQKANRAVRNAINSGKLPRLDTLQCHYCPEQANDYHHHKGYAPENWLDVVPICRKCHRKMP